MNIVKGFKSYIMEDDFQLNLFKNKINVVNYSSIGHFDHEKVIIKYEDKELIIKGENLSVTKLVSDEILIIGEFSNIEFR